jgi:DNA-binding transcriptional regulator YiaG
MKVRVVRTLLDITQSELAQLLGIHALTVSKWEREKLTPTAYQGSILSNLHRAAQKGLVATWEGTDRRVSGAELGRVALQLMADRGAVVALYILLHASQHPLCHRGLRLT